MSADESIERTEPPWDADELGVLHGFLDYFRATMLIKVAGLTDAQARLASCPPSSLNLIGLVRHLSEVERYWFQVLVAGHSTDDAPPIYYTDDDPDGDLLPPPDAGLEAAVATLQTEIAESRRLGAGVPPDQLTAVPRRAGHPNMRWVLVHMIEEYARHCGHADLLREAIDGTTGD